MIYLVEDDESIRELVVYTLKSQGMDAKGFERPSLFWKELEKEVPALILLDIMLPEEDGISILRKLRTRPDTRKTPVIMLTAKGTEYDVVMGLDSGADDYIPKPFRMMELISRIKARLRRAEDKGAEEYHLENLYLCPGRHIVTVDQEPVNLTLKEYEMLVLTRETAPPALEEASLPMPGQLRTGEWTLTCAAAVYQGEPQSGREFWLAGAEGLTVRPRRTGDRLERPGRPGRTVKKIMIDQKLPRHLRDTVPVLDSGGRVAAVAELGPDAAFLPRLGEPCWHITAKRKGEYFMLEKDIQEILFSEEQLAQRVKEIAGEINRDYVGQEIMLVSVLRGSFVFMADLCRRIDLPCTVDFMAVSSYGGGTSSSGQVQITKDLSSDITGKNIIVVEDILDSGNTLSYLLKVLEQRSPASIRLCTLLDKPERRVKPVEVHYSGFTIPDAFVVGYGLDYAEHYRNLPYIGILKPEVYGG